MRAQNRTSRLLDLATAEEAALGLRGVEGPEVVEGLVSLAERAARTGHEAAGVAAVRALAGRDDVRAREELGAALGVAPVSIRLEAALALEAHPDAAHAAALERCLREDVAPVVRRVAVHALAHLGLPHALAIVWALGDPVWRIRRDAIFRLSAPPPRGLGLAPGASVEPLLREAIAAMNPRGPALEGAIEYLARHTGVRLCEVAPAPPPAPRPAWWNEDPAALLVRMRHLAPATIVGPGIEHLLSFEDSRPYNDCATQIRAIAAQALLQVGSAADFLPAVTLLGEPRLPFVSAEIEALLARLAPDRRAAVAERVLAAPDLPERAIAWATGRLPPVPAPVSIPGGARIEPTDSPYLANRPNVEARERLWAERRETGRVDRPELPPLRAPERVLGRTGLRLLPLAVSGRYGLGPEAFDEALDRGARLHFWEPTYEGQTRWVRRLPAARRAGITFMAGTFEADPRAIRRDLDTALRLLCAETIDVFLVFWARSPERIGDDVLAVLTRLVEAGSIRTFGLSTHRRDLAARAAEDGWPVIMIRHSAAHRGAETEVLPVARAEGTGVITFSNLCYGRLLRGDHEDVPTPADCYRYSLAQPGVTTAISGPRDVLQLRENLRVLEQPDLAPDRIDALRAFGDKVYRDNREFFELVRWR